MRKKIFAVMIVAVVAAFAGYNVYQSQNTNTLSDLALANVEALAQNEGSGSRGTLYGNAAGNRYCCCPGSNSCGAANCSGC